MLLKSISRHPSTVAYRARITRINQTNPRATWSSRTLRCFSVAAETPVPRKRKVWDSVDEAIKDVKSGDTLLSGGSFYARAAPTTLISRLSRIRALRNTRYPDWSAREEEGRQKYHRRLKQRRIRRIWVGCARSDTNRLIYGQLNVLFLVLPQASSYIPDLSPR